MSEWDSGTPNDLGVLWSPSESWSPESVVSPLFDHLYTITMLIGLFGSLVIALRIISPIMIEGVHRLYAMCSKCKRKQSNQTGSQESQQSIHRSFSNTRHFQSHLFPLVWYHRAISLFGKVRIKLLSVSFFQVFYCHRLMMI